MEKGRGWQQVRSPRAPAAHLARLVPGERAVLPWGRGRRWEFAGRGRGEGLEEVADQPVGALPRAGLTLLLGEPKVPWK